MQRAPLPYSSSVPSGVHHASVSIANLNSKSHPSEQGMRPYQYTPIPSSGKDAQVRILALEAAKGKHDALTATLQICKLAEIDGKYEALSYTWGEKIFSERIVIDGRALEITRNLHDCLLRLRSKTRLLWIDAICINQDDLEERSAQVAIMGRIYSSAARTLAWLGEPINSDDAEAVFDLFRRAASRYERNNGIIDHNWPILQHTAEEQRTQGSPVVSEERLRQFLALPYFRRRWIVQEITLAREVRLAWGRFEVAWTDCFDVLPGLEHDLGDLDLRGPYKFVDDMAPEWDGAAGSSNILAVMTAYRFAECENPLDRIAALKGLWKDHGRLLQAYRVDYGQSVESNYTTFARLLAQTLDCGELLILAAITNSSHMPSWVPDWRNFTQSPLQQFPRISLDHKPSFGVQGTLVLKVWIIDRITAFDAAGKIKSASGAPWTALYSSVEPGDEVCAPTSPPSRRGMQFVIRKTATDVGRHRLVGICELRGWNEEVDPWWERLEELLKESVEIVLE